MSENEKRTSVRVYYEDTDFSGRVYHASYLRFLERGRTEWLREFGLQHGDLAKTRDITFAVVQVQLKFLAPAGVDDLLVVTTCVDALTGPLVSFQQTIVRETRTIAVGRVEVVTLHGDRPVKPPKEILAVSPGAMRRSRDRSAR